MQELRSPLLLFLAISLVLLTAALLILFFVDVRWYIPITTFLQLIYFLFFLSFLAVLVLTWRRLSGQTGEDRGHLQAAETQARKQHLQKVIHRRYQTRFWLSVIVYSFVLVFIGLFALYLKDSRTWYTTEPFFPLLLLLRNIFPGVMVALWLGGVVFLLYRQWRQSALDVVGLIDSIDQMYLEPENTNIQVPQNLIEIKPILQEIQYGSLRDRQKAKEAEQRKNDLIVYLAHDLKTPLTSVIGYLNLLDEVPDMPLEQKAKYTHIALEKAYRLENLLNQFFEISRYNLHEMVLEPERFDLHYLLLQLIDEFYPVLSREEKEAVLHAPEELWIIGDSEKLARVLNNILRNAISYSSPNSTILIEGGQDENSVTLSFQNRGRTIPAHQLEAIFDKFYRLDESRTSHSGGSGLGLAIAKEIITLHQGTIEATSEQGLTTFTITLPKGQSVEAPSSLQTLNPS